MEPKTSSRGTRPWRPTIDPGGAFSSGIHELDGLFGGGYRRGSFALICTEPSVGTSELHQLLLPLWLNFLTQSHGIIAVLPARESPHAFRAELLRHVSRRLFDSRVRVVDYVGEDDGLSYVVTLKGLTGPELSEADRAEAIGRMTRAEKAARGAGTKPVLELTSLEILEAVVGPQTATKMYLHGVKRTRSVGNLGIAIARPGLRCLDPVRSMVDYELHLRADPVGVVVTGVRPVFSDRLIVPDRLLGPPHVVLVPPPSPSASSRAAVGPAPARR